MITIFIIRLKHKSDYKEVPMKEQSITFNELTGTITRQLQEQNYLESTLKNYQRFYNRVERVMEKHSITEYSHDVGTSFLEELHS